MMQLPLATVAAEIELWAGLLAGVGAIAAVGVAWRTHHQDVLSGRVKDIREAMMNLIDLRERYASLYASSAVGGC